MSLNKYILFIFILVHGTLSLATRVETIVVKGEAIEDKINQVANAVTIVINDSIRENYQTVAEVLKVIPGLEVLTQGGGGKVSTLFLRGTNSEHTLVLIDGIEVNDPISPTRSFDFARLTLIDVERIEVIKGPQSVVFGSDALGGVINIITKTGAGPLVKSLGIEFGSFGLMKAEVGANAGGNNYNYNFVAAIQKQDGYSSANERDGNKEKDGYKQSEVSGKLQAELFANLSLEMVAKYVNATNELDRGGGPGMDDPNSEEHIEQFFSKLQLSTELLSFMETTFTFNFSNNQRAHTNRVDNLSPEVKDDYFKGRQIKFSLKNNIYQSNNSMFSLGIESEKEFGKTNKLTEKNARATGVYGLYKFDNKIFQLNQGLRYDFHSNSNIKAVSFNLSPIMNIDSLGSKLKVSLGSGFKVPSLSQLYDSTFGNLDLEEEKVLSWDVGWEQYLFADNIKFDVVYFENKFKNLITFDPASYKSINLSKSKIKGVELLSEWGVFDNIVMSVGYTRLLEFKNQQNNESLVRRSKNSFSAQLESKLSDNIIALITHRYLGSREDFDATNFSRIKLPSYTSTDINLNYQSKNKSKIYMNLNNIFNIRYEDIDGFASPKFNFNIGFKLKI